jgi:hypothetical protein
MFGESGKELALWIGGMLVAAGIAVWGAFYVVNNYIAPRDTTDPLSKAGGLNKQQKNK